MTFTPISCLAEPGWAHRRAPFFGSDWRVPRAARDNRFRQPQRPQVTTPTASIAPRPPTNRDHRNRTRPGTKANKTPRPWEVTAEPLWTHWEVPPLPGSGGAEGGHVQNRCAAVDGGDIKASRRVTRLTSWRLADMGQRPGQPFVGPEFCRKRSRASHVTSGDGTRRRLRCTGGALRWRAGGRGWMVMEGLCSVLDKEPVWRGAYLFRCR